MLRTTFALLASSSLFLACGARSTLVDYETSSSVTVHGDASTGGDTSAPVPDCHCDDGVACTRDICKSDASCTHVPDDAVCAEGDLCTASGCGPTLYVTVVRDGGSPRLATLDLDKGAVALVGGPSTSSIHAIALRSNGTLVALTDRGFAVLDRLTGEAAFEHSLPPIKQETGLVAAPDDTLYGLAHSSFFRLEHDDTQIALLTSFEGPDYGAGDLAFAYGALFASTRIGDDEASTFELSQLDPHTPGAFQPGSFIGFSCVNGLGASHGLLYGVTCLGFVLLLDEAGTAGTRFHTSDVFDDAAGR